MSEREQFEAWCREEGIDPDKSERTGVYSYPSARVAWRAWQASRRAALEEAAKVCDERCLAYWNAYKRSPVDDVNRANPHVEGVSDGAGNCAIAIRALAASDSDGGKS